MRRLTLPISTRKLSDLGGSAAGGGGGDGVAVAGEIGERHRGQERLDFSQVSMHWEWKAWRQAGRRRSSSESWNGERQTAQSRKEEEEGFAVEEEREKMGRDSMTDFGS